MKKTVKKPVKRTKKETFSCDNPRTLGEFLTWIEHKYCDGQNVSAQTAMGFPPFYRAVASISGIVARLPLKVFSSKTRQEDSSHMGGWVIRHPSLYYGRFQLIRSLVKDYLCYGNGYCLIKRDDNATPQGLNYVRPDLVQFDRKTLTYKVEGKPVIRQNIFHVRNMGDPYIGDDPIATCREAISVGLQMQKYGANWFTNNIGAWLYFSLPAWFRDDEQKKTFKDGLATQQGAKHAGEPHVLQGGATVNKLDPPSNESAQWVEGREHEAITASNIAGCPPHMVGSKISSSYNSFTAENRRFLSDIEPILKAYEEEANNLLLSETEKLRESRYFEFERASLLQADKEVEIRLIIDEVNSGLLTKNQGLALLNREGIGPNGDRYRIPTTITFEDLVDDTQTGSIQPSDQTNTPGQ